MESCGHGLGYVSKLASHWVLQVVVSPPPNIFLCHMLEAWTKMESTLYDVETASKATTSFLKVASKHNGGEIDELKGKLQGVLEKTKALEAP